MQIFKICSVTLKPIVLISNIPSFVKIRLKLMEKKQVKDDGQRRTTAHPVNPSSLLNFGQSGAKNWSLYHEMK